MPELQARSVEQIFQTSPRAREYAYTAAVQENILSHVEDIVSAANNRDELAPDSVVDLLEDIADDVIQEWVDNGEYSIAKRFETLLNFEHPRQIEELVEMAWEIRVLSAVDMYEVKARSAGSKSRQIINQEQMALNIKDFEDKYGLNNLQHNTLMDLLDLRPDELEEIWYKFEGVAHKSGQLEIARRQTKQRLEDEESAKADAKKQDELERKRHEKRAKAENDALTTANVIRFEVKKVVSKLDPKGLKAGKYVGLDLPYSEINHRSSWLIKPIADFLIAHPDKRRKGYREGWPKLQIDMLRYAVGRFAYEAERDSKKPAKKSLHISDESVALLTDVASSASPTDEKLRLLGEGLFADYNARGLSEAERRRRRQQWVDKIEKILVRTDKAIDKVAAKLIDTVYGLESEEPDKD